MFFTTSASVTDLPTGVSHGTGMIFVRYSARFIRLMSANSDTSWYNMYDGSNWSGWVKEAKQADIDTLNSKTAKTLTFVSGLEVNAQENYLFGNGLKQIAVQLHSTDNIPAGTNICTLPVDMRQAGNSFKPVFILDTNNTTIYTAYMSNEIILKKAITSGLYLSILMVYY